MLGEEQAPASEDAQHQHNDSCCHDEDRGHSKGNGLHQYQNQDACNSKEASSSEEETMNGMEEDDESEDEEEVGSADLVFPAVYSTALAQLLSAETQPIRVTDIELDGDDVKLDLAVTLWHEGIVTVQPEAQGKPAKRSKK